MTDPADASLSVRDHWGGWLFAPLESLEEYQGLVSVGADYEWDQQPVDDVWKRTDLDLEFGVDDKCDRREERRCVGDECLPSARSTLESFAHIDKHGSAFALGEVANDGEPCGHALGCAWSVFQLGVDDAVFDPEEGSRGFDGITWDFHALKIHGRSVGNLSPVAQRIAASSTIKMRGGSSALPHISLASERYGAQPCEQNRQARAPNQPAVA